MRTGGGNPPETARKAEKGSLKSPYADFAKVAEEGHQKFMAAGCNGCHGGAGGGGMGPPLTNQVWVYGKDDDTLFRLIALGSDELQKQGYSRKGSENVVGPMPPMGTIVKSDDDMWKIIAWIRSVNPSSAGGEAPQPSRQPSSKARNRRSLFRFAVASADHRSYRPILPVEEGAAAIDAGTFARLAPRVLLLGPHQEPTFFVAEPPTELRSPRAERVGPIFHVPFLVDHVTPHKRSREARRLSRANAATA